MKETCKVGDRVQCEEYNYDTKTSTIHTGVLTELHMKTEDQPDYSKYYSGKPPMKSVTYLDEVTVTWDDGEVERLNSYSVHPEDTEYERAFRTALTETNVRINEKLELASQYLSEAVAISEETGVPFGTGISFLSQNYRPTTLDSKFPELEKEFIRSVSECYNDYDGWEHSAVC